MHAVNAHIRFLRIVVSLSHRHPTQKYPVFAPVSRCVRFFGEESIPAPERDFEPVLGGFEQTTGAPKKEKAPALFCADCVHSSPQCELPQGFAGFGD